MLPKCHVSTDISFDASELRVSGGAAEIRGVSLTVFSMGRQSRNQNFWREADVWWRRDPRAAWYIVRAMVDLQDIFRDPRIAVAEYS